MEANKEFTGIDAQKHGELLDMLRDLRSMDIGGHKVMQLPDGEFVEHVLMDEEYFIANWLPLFAIGMVNGKNYFNQDSWNVLTDGYTKGVIVLNKEKEPVLVIRKFIDMDLGINHKNYLDQVTRQAAHAANIPDKADVDSIVNNVATIIEQVTSQNEEWDTLTMMIPWQYYLDHGINPYVSKQVVYIRDTFSYKGVKMNHPINGDLLDQVTDILLRNSRSEKITPAEKALVNEITQNTFIFNGEANKVEDQSSSTDRPFDLLSD